MTTPMVVVLFVVGVVAWGTVLDAAAKFWDDDDDDADRA